jgi:ABC-2 type transport system permease protein
MAVYKHRYESYRGRLTERWSRGLVLTRYALRELFHFRFFSVSFVIALVPVLIFGSYVFIANNDLLHMFLSVQPAALAVEPRFFVIFLNIQTFLAFLLTCWAAPTLVAGDLTNGALALFLSRPLTRAEYVGGKFAVLAILLSFITWVPALVLFFLEAALSHSIWLGPHLWMIGPILWCTWLWITLLSLMALAASAWVKWRVLAMASIFGVFLIPAGFGGVLNATLHTKWGNLLNLSLLFQEILSTAFRSGFREGAAPVPEAAAWAMMVAVCLASLLLLRARLRAFEVARG